MPCGICHVEDYYAMSYRRTPLAKVSKSKNKVIVWYTGIVYLFFTPKNKFRIFLKLNCDFKIKKIKNRLALASPFINLSYIF